MANASSDLTVARLTAEQRKACPAVGEVGADGRTELLVQLCHPFKPEKFFKQTWRSRALAVNGHKKRFAALIEKHLFSLSLGKLLRESPSEEIHVWFARAGGNESLKVPSIEAALACHRAGGSLYFRAPPSASDLLVTALSQQLGLSFGALHSTGEPRGEVETFVTREGHVTDWHFDFMENFTLQLSGTKTWRLKRSAVDVPLRGCTPMWGHANHAVRSAAEQQSTLHAQHAKGPFESRPDPAFFADADEVVLRPGSVLYVPAGMWHRVECTSDSVSINVSLMGASWAEHVAEALKQRLLCHASARAPVCMVSVDDGRAQLARIMRVASEELARLTPSVLLPAGLGLPRVARLRVPPPLELRARYGIGAGTKPIRRGSRFRRSPLAVLLRLPEGADGDASDDDDDDDDDDEEEEEEEEADCSEGDDDDDGGEGRAADDSATPNAQRRSKTRCGGDDRLISASDLLLNAADGTPPGGERSAIYVLRSHLSGEDLSSLLRIELLAPPELEPLLEWCCVAPPAFSAARAWRAAGRGQAWGASFDDLVAVLAVLEHYGFVVRAPPKKKGARKASASASAVMV